MYLGYFFKKICQQHFKKLPKLVTLMERKTKMFLMVMKRI